MLHTVQHQNRHDASSFAQQHSTASLPGHTLSADVLAHDAGAIMPPLPTHSVLPASWHVASLRSAGLDLGDSGGRRIRRAAQLAQACKELAQDAEQVRVLHVADAGARALVCHDGGDGGVMHKADGREQVVLDLAGAGGHRAAGQA